MRFKWTEDADTILMTARERGDTFAEISRVLGVSRQAAIGREMRLRAGVKPRTKMTPEQFRKHVSEYNKKYFHLGDTLPPEGPVLICGPDGTGGGLMCRDFEGAVGKTSST